MKIYVISLLHAVDRRESIRKQMAEKNLAFEFVDGVTVNPVTMLDTGFDLSKRTRYYGYSLHPGEVGCFLAHKKAWEKVQLRNEKCLILEDDVLIDDLTLEILDLVAHSKLPILRLACIFQKPHKFIYGTNFARYWGDPGGAVAYVLGPNEATHLLEKSESFYLPVDDFLESTQIHGLYSYGLLPYPIRHAGLDSYIESRQRPPLSKLVRLRRMFLRIPIDINKQIRRFFYYYF
jgi:glycosyl transferase family 25